MAHTCGRCLWSRASGVLQVSEVVLPSQGLGETRWGGGGRVQAGEWRLLLSSWAAELLSLLVFKGQAGSGEEVAAPSQEELSLDISQLLCLRQTPGP